MSADTGLDIVRRIKARRIAKAIRNLGGDAAEARLLSEREWGMADAVSRGLKVALRCPSEATRALVIEYLERPAVPTSDPRDEDIPPA